MSRAQFDKALATAVKLGYVALKWNPVSHRKDLYVATGKGKKK